MTSLHIAHRVGFAAVAAFAVAGVTACSDSLSVLHGPTPVDPLFQSYVALGNSITAGYQSGGINDSTQLESYAHLIAKQMNTRYAYASLTAPGCPPPIMNFQTQERLANGTSTTCQLRNPASITNMLNNVAVPGATSADPTAVSTPASNALSTFILGGRTQVQKAAEANPTFISAWIGNNDVLPEAVAGLLDSTSSGSTVYSRGITSEANFQANYDVMVTGLKQIPTLKGAALIGVVQVAAAPVLFNAAALLNPAFKAGFDQYAGQVTTILPSCTPTVAAQTLISFQIVSAIRAGTHPPVIGCAPNSVPGTLVGDIFVLDATEQATLAARVTAYNTYIQSVATANGWAYYDPNTTLTTLKTSGCIAAIPNLASAVHPFGNCVSLDGVHPTGMAHRVITNDLIDAINAKYSTTLAHVTVMTTQSN